MKKHHILPLVTAALLLSGCGESPTESSTSESGPDPDYMASLANDGFDVDLTQVSDSMMYSQIYYMTTNSEYFIGLTVRVTGNFRYRKDSTGKEIFSVFMPGAAACCSDGIEFILDGDYTYPDDYPEIDQEITVTGVFSAYEEYMVTYCQLLSAEIMDMDSGEGERNEEN